MGGAVCLMDPPVMDGVDAIRTITADFPAARILALTTYEGDDRGSTLKGESSPSALPS